MICVGLFGCATTTADPRITNNLADWRGRPAAELVGFQGEPTRVVKDPDGSELWEYYKAVDMIVPKGENMSFFGGVFGGSGASGGSGAFSSEKRPEDRTSHVESTMRYKIRQGVIVAVFASRVIDAKVVWEDHWQ